MDSNDKRENNESLLKNNLNELNKFSNNYSTQIEEINDNKACKTYSETDFKENKENENLIYIKENLFKCQKLKKQKKHKKNKRHKKIKKIQKHEKQFTYYCKDCKFDLCDECLKKDI